MIKRLYFSLSLLTLSYVQLHTQEWTGNGDQTTWSDGANWSGGVAPGAGDTATFTHTPSVGSSVTISGTQPIQQIVFNGNTAPFTIQGDSSTATLQFSSFPNAISCTGGPYTVETQIQFGLGNPAPGFIGDTQLLLNGPFILSPNPPTDFIGIEGNVTLGGNNQFPLVEMRLVSNSPSTNCTLSNLGALGDLLGSPLASLRMDDAICTIDIANFNTSVPFDLNSGTTNQIDTQTFTATFEGVISGTTSLTKTGSGTLILNGINTYSGGTVLSEGILEGNNVTIPGDVLTASSTTLRFNQATTGTFSSVIGGLGSVVKIGAGNLTLSGINTYSGGTTVSAGILQGNTTSLQGSIINNAAVIFDQAGPGTYAGDMSGTGALTKIGAGTLTLSGTNSYSGGTTVTAGTLQGDTTSLQGSITNNATVTFSQSGLGTYSGVISGTGSVIKSGAGTVIFSGANSYSGGTTVTAGTLQGNTTSLQGNITNNATVTFSQSGSGTYSGVISGTGSVIKSGTGTVIFSGANSYSGGTTVSTGILQGNTTSLQGNITNNATVTFSQSGSGTYSGVISGTGSVIKSGTGTVTFSGANTYSGGTTINQGTLGISVNENLGDSTGPVSISNGTLFVSGGGALSTSRAFTLTGTAIVNANVDVTLTGNIGGGGLLQKTGVGTTLFLIPSSGVNSYTGGTQVLQGILSGTTSGIQGSVLAASGTTVQFSQTTIGTYGGVISGGGIVEKENSGAVTFTGINTYTGGTNVNGGTLIAGPANIPGNVSIANGATLSFNASSGGTYAGTLSGLAGSTFAIGSGEVTVTGTSSGFLGSTQVNGGTLILNGSLANSSTTVASGATLKGTGTVGTVANSGSIAPGSSIGTLTVAGDLSFTSGGTFDVEVSPTNSDLLVVQGTATLTNGVVTLSPESGFYRPLQTYTILTAGSIVGTFNNSTINGPFYSAQIFQNANSVFLNLFITRPFLNFPFGNPNERAVGENLDEISAAGEASADLLSVLDQLGTLSIAEINEGLDQMHPAAMGAFADLQVNLGGQLLSQFHKKPMLSCGCFKESRVWVQPFGNWLQEKQQGMQIGFHATSKGIAIGYDHQLFNEWSVGAGAAWNGTDLSWSLDRGHATINGVYGALYSDVSIGNYYLGVSTYVGGDWYDTARHIEFAEINREAKADFGGVDFGTQCKMAYFLGSPSCLFYPYLDLDYLYLGHAGFSEDGAASLNLNVNSYSSSTFRGETGIGLQVVDRNIQRTFCMSPLISLGYTILAPIHRDRFQSTFQGQSIPFSTKGRDKVWQLLNVHFGLGLTYRCFQLDSEYIGDISTKGNRPFFNQRANFRLSARF